MRSATDLKKILLLGPLVISLITACSGDKGPPDDPGDYSACAAKVLQPFALTSADAASLVADSEKAIAVSASTEVFETARASLKASCL